MSVFSSDRFAGAYGANVTSRAGEVGATWIAHPYSQGTMLVNGQGFAYSTTFGGATFLYSSGVTTSTTYTVTANITTNVTSTYQSPTAVLATGVMGYVSTSAFTLYLARYNFSGLNQWELYKVVNNVATLLGVAAATLVVGTTYKLRLALAPSSQQLQVSTDGGTTYVTQVTATDSAVPFSGTTGVHGLGDQTLVGTFLSYFAASDTTTTLTTTSPSVYKAATQAAIYALGPLLSNLLDEHGVAFPHGQLRGIYGSDTVQFPNVTVRVKSAKATYFNGKGLIGQDSTTGLFLYGYYIFDAQLRLTVQGRSEAEREWITDTLLAGVPGFAVTDHTVTPNVLRPGAVEDSLGAFGIVVKGHGEIEWKEPDLKNTRPEGQIYEATIPFICDFSLGWEEVGTSASTFLIAAGPLTTNPLPLAVSATVHA